MLSLELNLHQPPNDYVNRAVALSVDMDFRFLMPRRQLLIAGENLLLRAIDPEERKIGSLIPSDFATAVLFLLLDIDRSGNYNMTRLAA